MGEDQASITETQRQVRALYKTVKELYDLINECDPSFIQALLDTEDPKDSNDQNNKATDSSSPAPNCVTVIAERVNIRAAPSSDSAIIAQALFGTSFQVDQQSVASLSERQRLAMKMGEDWYPVSLPDGNRGYIFSRYVTEADQQRK
jgi:SH3-like domain-containing protein